MSQEQFDLIVKIIRGGAPALAPELIMALMTLVKEHNRLKELETNTDDVAEQEG